MKIVNCVTKRNQQYFYASQYHLSNLNNKSQRYNEYEKYNLYPLFEDLEKHFNIDFSKDFNYQAFNSYLLNNYFITNSCHEEQYDLFFDNETKQLNLPFYFHKDDNKNKFSFEQFEKVFYNISKNHNISPYVTKDVFYHLDDYINNIDSAYLHIKNNLHSNFYKQNEKCAFYNLSKTFKKSLHIINNSFPQEIQNYRLEITHIVEKHKENGRTFKSFCPGGMCHFGQKIMINSDLFSYIPKYGRLCDAAGNKTVFYHELGHAIHNLVPEKFIKNNLLINYQYVNNGVLKHPKFISCVKQNYVNFKYFNIPSYLKKHLYYYVQPLNNYLSHNIKKRKAAWNRTTEECFAETISMIMVLFIDGIDIRMYHALYRDESYARNSIKVFMPTIKFLLKNIDWIKLGIPEHLYRKRMPLVKNFLKKIDFLPLNLKKGQAKSYVTKKSLIVPKITPRMVLR